MRDRTWTPAPDLLDEWNGLSDIEKAAVELVVYGLNSRKPSHYPEKGTMERALIDAAMELPITGKLIERAYRLAA